ncbi:ATP-binding protein [Arcicella sp. LKC2W]|uniref:ATP-binding protein n=1 Tax=Arcicella sp. LKC2W TaxID=2984198 RepID=UPI002B2057DD|nr:ATP-binding protein [Arcicella sp. LKC2W]MEA5457697.1 ATP-binding protein [Arcicella sp. LKC2W]
MKTLTHHSIFLLILILFNGGNGFTQGINLSKTKQFPANITSSIEIFRDSTKTLTLEQIKTQHFKKHTKKYFVFPYSNDDYWVRFTLNNTETKFENWILMWTNPLAEQLDFYVPDSLNKGFLHKQQKIITSEREKKFIQEDPIFPFKLLPKQAKTIYIKLSSQRGHYGTIRLYTPEAYHKSRLDDFAGEGFLNGLIFFRLFLVLVLSFFVIKDLSFRLYSLYTIIRTFNYWGFLNIAGPLFTDDPDMAKKLDFLFYNSATLGAGLFILVAFKVHKFHRLYLYSIVMILVVNIFLNAIIFFDYQWYWLKGGAYLIIASSIYYIILNVYFTIKKTSFAKYYSILFIFGLCSTCLLYVRLLGWIEFQPIYMLSYYFFLAEFFFFIFFLGQIFKNTERNKLIAEQKLNFNLEQNARLKELDNIKTQFFTNISHEFRTPLTLLVGPIDDLQKKYPQEGIIAVMKRNLQRLQSLINQLLDLSKLEAGEMTISVEEVDLVPFFRQIFASFESLAQGKQIIFNHSQSHLQQFGKFDLDKLEKILTNLLSNAFKFTSENGRIIVRVDFKVVDEKGLINISVQDFGIGISSERLPHIFDRFYQIDDTNQRQHEGTGIGLSLVKELINFLEGKIQVNSQLGEGTTFHLTLPFVALNNPTENLRHLFVQENLISQELQEENIVTETEGQNVMLIVEDNADLRNYIGSIFGNDFQLMMAVDGEEGLKKSLEYIPDIVICDLMMPNLDGLGFCEKLKNDERINHIPVIMLTAKATLSDKLIGLGKGADDYVSKPFNREELILRVHNLVAQRQLMREKYAPIISDKTQIVEVVKELTIDEIFIQKAKSIIDKYLDKSEFDVDTFANEMNLSSVQLRRKLKAITNQTVTEFVRNYRLAIAADSLKRGIGSVSEIAYQVGFDSLPYFSKVFLERYGKTPSDWK